MRTMPATALNRLKKILLSRVELWIVALLLSVATLGFGAFMKDGAERSAPLGGVLGRVAFRIGAMPESLFRRFFPDPVLHAFAYGLAKEQRFPAEAGLVFAESSPPLPGRGGTGQEREDGEAGYLAVARHVPISEEDVAEPDGTGSVSVQLPVVVEIIDLNRRKVVHAWKPVSGFRPQRFFVLPDGSLLGVTRGRAVFRMDACSNVVWEQPLGAHHSFERGVDGNFWSPWIVAPNTLPHKKPKPDFVEDGFIRFSPAGEVLARVELSGALMRAGHRHLLYGYGAHSTRPFHMNDVEPVLQDGPFWRRGDLFVSLRNSSVVLLYRPATDEVVWLQAGPWLHQHDIDVLSDSEISVFSNNMFVDEEDAERVLGANEVYVHDFATGETRSPWREAMRRHDVRTETAGGATVFADGSVMLEEADYGRVLMLSPDGERVWSYVNRASDGGVYELQASRWLDAEYGAEVARSIASRDCGAATN